MESKPKKKQFSYKITPQTLKKYEQNEVYFTVPRLVAFYDINYGKITDAKRIKYFQCTNFLQYPIDLNGSFGTYVRRNNLMILRHIGFPLNYYMTTSAAECDGGCVDNGKTTTVIAKRGTLVRIMEAYYNRRYNLSIRVSRYNGNIYMLDEDFDDTSIELKPANTHHLHLDKLLFTDSPGKSTKYNEPCDENVSLAGIYRSNFGKYDIIYSCEIQGIMSNEEFKDFDDLEALNDCRFVYSKQVWKKLNNKDFKYLNYWLQSYLGNVKDVFIGHKNDNGIIEDPIEYHIARDLPKNRFWKPAICTGFLHDFLQNVEKRMYWINCLNTVYVYSYNDNIFSYEVFKGKSDKTFITKEYMEYCKKMAKV